MIKIIGGPQTKDIKVIYTNQAGVEVEIKDIFRIGISDILPLKHVIATIEVLAEIDIEVDDFNIIEKNAANEK